MGLLWHWVLGHARSLYQRTRVPFVHDRDVNDKIPAETMTIIYVPQPPAAVRGGRVVVVGEGEHRVFPTIDHATIHALFDAK